MAAFFCLFAVATLLVGTRSTPHQSTELNIKLPDECQKEGFCSIKPEGYDKLEEKMNKLLATFLTNVGKRDGTDETTSETLEIDQDNCPSRKTTKQVYLYNFEKYSKKDILVSTDQFKQEVTEVTCAYDKMKNGLNNHGQQCYTRLALGNLNMKTTCHEFTAHQSFLIYEANSDAIVIKNYSVPVCCACRMGE